MDDQYTRSDINALFDYVVSTDARVLGMQMALSRILMPDDEKREAFETELEQNYQAVYQVMKGQAKERWPELYARVYGDA